MTEITASVGEDGADCKPIACASSKRSLRKPDFWLRRLGEFL